MRRLTGVLAVVLVAAFGASSYAARDSVPATGGVTTGSIKPLTKGQASGRLELLVFEIDGCSVCDVFRRDVLPQYQTAPTATRAPLRFVDINKTSPDTLALRSSLSQVPTVVLMQDGREVDRITGYVGPSAFFRMLDVLLAKVE